MWLYLSAMANANRTLAAHKVECEELHNGRGQLFLVPSKYEKWGGHSLKR